MNKNEFINKLRMFLADAEGLIWDDVELGSILDDALKQYSIDSGIFVGRFDFFPNSDGTYSYPDNFASFMIGWNENGDVITPTSSIELFQKRGESNYKSGAAEYIYDDSADYGEFCIYPTPQQNIKNIVIDGEYGEIDICDYGVILSDNYGVICSVDVFDFAGEMYYNKIGRFEDVKDHMAIIYYAMSMAYSTDADFSNSDAALFWQRQYKNRLNAFSKIKNQNNGMRRTGIFY